MFSKGLEIAIRDCHIAIQVYDLWDAVLKVQAGEMLIQEFCESHYPLSPCKDCPNRETEECEYCYPSCEIGGGSITCPLKVSTSYSSDVCYLAQQCYEKLLKHLLRVSGIKPPKEHDLVKLLRMLPVDLRARKLKDLINCINLLKNYNVVRYTMNLPQDTVINCRNCVDKLLTFIYKSLSEGGWLL